MFEVKIGVVVEVVASNLQHVLEKNLEKKQFWHYWKYQNVDLPEKFQKYCIHVCVCVCVVGCTLFI